MSSSPKPGNMISVPVFVRSSDSMALGQVCLDLPDLGVYLPFHPMWDHRGDARYQLLFKKKKKSLYFNPVSVIWTQARLHWASFGPAKPHPSQVAPLSRLLTFAHPYVLGAAPTGVVLLAGVGDWHRRQGCWREDPLVAAPLLSLRHELCMGSLCCPVILFHKAT